MELIFGAVFGVPLAFLVSGLYAKFACWLSGKNRILWSGVVVLSGLVCLAIAVEIGLILSLGIVTAHDNFYPLLDRLHASSILFGPAALTNLALEKLRSSKAPADAKKTLVWIVCFLAILCVAVSSELYEDAAHYRTDGEGTYRIEE